MLLMLLMLVVMVMVVILLWLVLMMMICLHAGFDRSKQMCLLVVVIVCSLLSVDQSLLASAFCK